MTFYQHLAIAALTLTATTAAQAQATVKPDGQFRASLGLGASLSTGNSESSNLSLAGDAVRATTGDKITLYGNAQVARSNGLTTSEQIRLGGRYDRNLGQYLFAFGGLDLERNKFANLQLRSQLSGGLGYHLIKSEAHTLDLFGGPSYTSDKYLNPMVVDGQSRDSYAYASLLLGEESSHQLSASTRFKQRLVLVPNLKNRGEFRATWDAGLSVSMSKTLNLTVGLAAAHNSDPGIGRKATDTLLTTGVSVKFD